jgi:hypothetical protein
MSSNHRIDLDRPTDHGHRLLRLAAAGALAATTVVASFPAATAGAQPPPTAVPTDAVCAGAPEGSPFTDVPAGDGGWEAEVRCLAHARVTRGAAPGRYLPHQPVTRAQMASFVTRTADLAAFLGSAGTITPLDLGRTAAPYRDVRGDEVHQVAIHRLTEAGVVQGGPGGRPDDVFGPHLTVSRGQMATFLAGTIEHLTGSAPAPGPDRFADDDGDAHEDAVDALAALGIVQGHEDGTYRPGAPVGRGQMATYLVRTLAHLHADGRIDPLPAQLPPIGVAGSAVHERWGRLGPELAVVPNDDTDGTAGSGCRPGDDRALPDGVWMVEVTGFGADELDVALQCFRTVDSDLAANPVGGGLFEDWEYEAADGAVRRVPLAPGAPFFLQTVPSPSIVGEPTETWRVDDPATAAHFARISGDATPLAWVLVEGGRVVEVYAPPLQSA